MLLNPMDVLDQFPVRKSKNQKQAFRDAVQSYCEGLDYSVRIESGRYGCQNVVIGDPKTAKFLVTAHYDTPARLLFPNFAAPCNALFTISKLILTILVFGTMGYFGGYWMGTGRVLPGMLIYSIPLIYIPLVLVGPANRHNANDNTSGVVTALEIARTLPENQRDKVCFVLFDLEEAGLIGSASYRKAHKEETDRQIVLNLDCVGDGDEILLIPTKTFRKDLQKLSVLYPLIGRYGEKTIDVREKGFASYASDQKHFPSGVGIAALHRKKGIGLYLSRIHTSRDTILDITNVNILRAALTTLICQ